MNNILIAVYMKKLLIEAVNLHISFRFDTYTKHSLESQNVMMGLVCEQLLGIQIFRSCNSVIIHALAQYKLTLHTFILGESSWFRFFECQSNCHSAWNNT